MVHLPVAPLMHGATQWCVMGQSFVGSKIVLMAKFEPARCGSSSAKKASTPS